MNYKDVNDYELLYMISDGEDDNVELLLEKYQPFIAKKCLKWSGVVKKMNLDMEDLEQEVRIAFIDAVRSYRQEDSACFYTYVNVLVDRKIYSLLRKLENNKNRILKDVSSLHKPVNISGNALKVDNIVDISQNLEEKIEEFELIDEIRNYMFNLSMEDSCIFELHLSGYSVNDIASLLDKDISSVRIIISKLRKKFKKYLLDLELLVV